MKWFRLHSEFATDPKLKTFTKMQRYDLICLLCLANESKERGVINLDPEDIAATIDQDEAEYAAFIAKLSKKGILSQREDGAIVFTNWLTRQYDKLSDTPKEAAARQQKCRTGAADSVTTAPNNKVSRGCHADVTPSHAIYSDTEAESDTDKYSDSEEKSRKEAAAMPAKLKPTSKPKYNPAAFEQVFQSYPEAFRESRAVIIERWDHMRPSPDEINAMLVFIEGAKKTDRWRGQFIKQFKVFLSEKTWEDNLSGYADREKGNRKGQTATSDIEKMAASMLSRSMPALTGGN